MRFYWFIYWLLKVERLIAWNLNQVEIYMIKLDIIIKFTYRVISNLYASFNKIFKSDYDDSNKEITLSIMIFYFIALSFNVINLNVLAQIFTFK